MSPKLKDLKYLKDINLDKAKAQIDQFAKQARESLKVLESLQKEGMSLAKNFIEKDMAKTKKFADEKIKKNLHRLGIASREEVREIEKKLESLSGELKNQFSKIKKNKPQD